MRPSARWTTRTGERRHVHVRSMSGVRCMACMFVVAGAAACDDDGLPESWHAQRHRSRKPRWLNVQSGSLDGGQPPCESWTSYPVACACCRLHVSTPRHHHTSSDCHVYVCACRAKNIRNRPELNQKISKTTMIKELAAEIEKLKVDLQCTREKNGVFLSADRHEQVGQGRCGPAGGCGPGLLEKQAAVCVCGGGGAGRGLEGRDACGASGQHRSARRKVYCRFADGWTGCVCKCVEKDRGWLELGWNLWVFTRYNGVGGSAGCGFVHCVPCQLVCALVGVCSERD